MAILVLGGAGYIGSHTVYELIDAGREVVVADNLQTGFRAAVHPKAKFYQLDIRDKGALDTLFQAENIEGVIHFAASSQVGESMSDPLKYYDNNLHGTMVLLQAPWWSTGWIRLSFPPPPPPTASRSGCPFWRATRPSHQLLRPDQAGHGADDGAGCPGPRPAVCGAALL